jgi:hypothetical protein
MSASAAALAAGLIGTVVAAPTAPSKTPPKTSSHKTASKANAISKFREHQLDMLKVSAPGDEYFGRLKLSYLGINNTFHDQTVRAGDYTTSPDVISKVAFADEALHAWANKYPHDPELARSYFLAIRTYKKIYTRTYQDKAWQYMHILTNNFGKTYFGKLEKKDLAIGFTEHYFAEPVPCPTPAPSPLPGAKPTPTPEPTMTPVPTPSPTAAPGQPKIDILTPPCVAAPTPAPLPTIAPSGAPSPAASGAPIPLPSASPVPIPTGAMTPVPVPSPAATPTHHPR